jgi:hypothetical protein
MAIADKPASQALRPTHATQARAILIAGGIKRRALETESGIFADFLQEA